MSHPQFAKRLASSVLAVAALALPALGAAQVSVVTLGTPLPQNFDGLLTTGSATWANNTTIPGWFHARTGTGTTIVASPGTNTAGNLYSFGTGTNTDRALGSLGSGNAAVGNLFWGVRLQNNSGTTITSIDVSYTGEQWRNSAAAAQAISFSYLVGSPTVTGTLAEFQTAGVAVPALDFTSPITGGAAGALDGNLAANRTAVSFSITGLSIPNGTEVMLRWADPDHTGTDHGLSIDDLSITPNGAAPVGADLTITNADSPDPVNAGDDLTYTVTVTNNGPSDATAAEWNETLPAGTTFVSMPPVAGWTCSTPAVGATGVVSCTNPLFVAGSAVFTLTVNVDPATAAATVISSTATTSSTTTDPAPGNESATATTTVATSADLSLTKTDTPDPVLAGNAITYTISAANAGPSNADTVSISDTLPAGTTFTSLASPPGWTCSTPAVGATGTVTCSIAALVLGSQDFTLVVGVDASVASATVISNTATITSATSDPNTGDESGTATTTVATSADVSVTKSDSPDPVFAGGLLTYTIDVNNAGPSDAATVSLSDALPASTTFASLSAPGGWSCTTPAVGATGTVTCDNASFAVGTATFTLGVTVDAATLGGTTISNTAIVTSATPDSNGGNNAANADTTVGATAEISLTKTDTPDPVVAGSNITYTLTVTNAGPDEAQSLSLDDTLPAGVTFVSLAEAAGWSCTTPAVGAGGTVNCSVATMPVGTAVFTLVVNVDVATPPATIITNNASVSTTINDPIFVNNIGSASTTVGSASADLSITKTDTPDPVTAGSNITYTITATNNGPDASTTVSMADALPAGTTFVSLASPGGWSCSTPAVGGTGTVTCNIATLANAGTGVFTLVVAVDAATAGGTVITNTATVAGATTDSNAGNNSATATTDVVALQADLSVTKTGLPANVAPGGNLTYTINVANAGPSAAANVALTDVVPANTTFVSATAPAGWTLATPAVGGTGTVTATNASLASGATAAFTIVVQVGAATPNATVISNTASVASTTSDSNAGNNSATTTSTVQVATADLSVVKTDLPDPVLAGSNITYSITVANAGPAAATNVSLTDTLPANTTFVSATAPAGWTLAAPAVGGTGTITATNPSLAAAGTANFTVVVQVGAATANGTVISNTANVASTTADANNANNASTATTTVTGLSADLSVTKSDAPDPVVAGSSITYTIVANNAGPNAATAVTLTDALPANTTFVSATAPGGWTLTTPAVGATGTVTATLPTLATGTPQNFTIVVQVNAGVAAGTVISNTATIASTTADPAAANNTATTTSTTSAAPAANVNGTKTAAGTFVPGSTVTYSIVLTNSGSGAQGDNPGNEFTDVLPASLQLVSATATSGTAVATIGTNTVIWNGAIPAAGTVTITITATLPAATAPGTTITNQGTIATDLDNNGTNETTRTTDDPSTGGADATGFVVQGAGQPFVSPITIPAFGDAGRLLLVLMMAVFAMGALGRTRK